MKSDRTKRVQLALGSYISRISKFWRIKCTEMLALLSGYPYTGLPARTVARYTKQSARAVIAASGAHVLLVFCIRRFAQIVPFIVRAIRIAVVDHVFWPLARHVKKCQPRGPIREILNLNNYVPIFVRTPGNRPGSLKAVAIHAPHENPGFGAIMQKFAETFRCKIGSSHDAFLLRKGAFVVRRPAGATTRVGLRYFTLLGAIGLCGCTAQGGLISAEYCTRVSYLRTGSNMHVEADCALPVQGPSLPIAPAALLGGVP